MTQVSAIQLAVAAAFCGVTAFWLVGVYLHLHEFTRARSQSRKLIQVLLNMSSDHAAERLIGELNRSPFFTTGITHKIQDVITAWIRPIHIGGGKNACNLACRIGDLGKETQIIARLDFTPLVDRAFHSSQIWLLALWPIWIVVVFGGVGAWFAFGEPKDLVSVAHMSHAIYPIVGLLAVQMRFRRVRYLIEDTVSAIIKNLGFISDAAGEQSKSA